MQTILVTGGAGFIGSHIVDALCARGAKRRVIVIDNLSSGKKENLNKNAKFIKMDIRDSKLESVFKKEKPNYVFHLAAQIDVRKSVADPLNDVDVNILGSLNVLENCKKYGVNKVIFSSTGGAIYPEEHMPATEYTVEYPVSPYGINKLCVDRYLHYYHTVFGLKYTSLRFANVYGPRQDQHGESGVVAIFVNKFLRGEIPTQHGKGLQTRDYIYVKDVVTLAVKAMNSSKSGVYNVGTGQETPLRDLVSTIKSLGDFSVKVNQGPAKKGEVMRSCLDCQKALSDFGWQPKYSLEDGLLETINWFNDQY